MQRLKPVIFFVLLSVILFLSYHYGLSEKFMRVIPEFRETVKQNPISAMIIYILVTSVSCVMLALPGAAFAVIAGLLFEPLTGTILCIIAATLGAVFSFLASRYFLKEAVRPMLERNVLLKKFLFEDVGCSGIILLMVTRLVPLFPYNLQNFAYGLTDMKILPYTIYTFLFITPGSAAFTLGAAGISNAERRSIYIFLAVIIALIVTLAGIILRKNFIKE